MANYADVLAEVSTILSYLEFENFKKIPKDVINAIESNKNKNYNYEYDSSKKLKDQNLMPETKAIISNLYRDYIAMPQRKEEIIEKQRIKRIQNELKKKEIYKGNELFKKKDPITTTDIVVIESKKENIFKKIYNKIKSLFI